MASGLTVCNVELRERDFRKISSLVYQHCGINLHDGKKELVRARLAKRLRLGKFRTFSDYMKHVLNDSTGYEFSLLIDTLSTNMTSFFRGGKHFDFLAREFLPALFERKRKAGRSRIRGWSAGCSSGEEPYTNAMVLTEHLPPGFKVEIIASDLSLKSLMKAKEGFYPSTKISGIPDNYLKKYMDPVENGYKMKDSIKSLIKFDYHNLKFPSDAKNFDVIFCRNVLIYFDELAQKNVIEGFWNSMGDRSYLFIGHSESLFGMDTKFEFIKTDWACIYGKNVN